MELAEGLVRLVKSSAPASCARRCEHWYQHTYRTSALFHTPLCRELIGGSVKNLHWAQGRQIAAGHL